MKAYVTFHGQAKDEHSGLTEIGIKQSHIFAEHMKNIGFLGGIYYSEHLASSETAKIIKEYTGSEINKFEDLNKIDISDDVLFIGNEQTVNTLLNTFGKPGDYKVCNCSLSIFNLLDENAKKVYGDDGHLPYNLRGYNLYMKSQEDKEKLNTLIKNGINIPEKFKNSKSKKLLHISDTPSYLYPYYEKIIQEIKPDIIIHTGDFSDELKAGRVKLSIPEYIERIPEIARILKNSGAEIIYAVCGNNDIESELKKNLSEAVFVKSGEIVDICGIKCSLGHARDEVSEDAEWLFYGHGLTGEKWSPDKNNIKEGMCRFNAIWNISLILLPEREIFTVPYPGL